MPNVAAQTHGNQGAGNPSAAVMGAAVLKVLSNACAWADIAVLVSTFNTLATYGSKQRKILLCGRRHCLNTYHHMCHAAGPAAKHLIMNPSED